MHRVKTQRRKEKQIDFPLRGIKQNAFCGLKAKKVFRASAQTHSALDLLGAFASWRDEQVLTFFAPAGEARSWREQTLTAVF